MAISTLNDTGPVLGDRSEMLLPGPRVLAGVEAWELWSMLTVLAPGVEHYYEEADGRRAAWILHPDGSWARRRAGRSGSMSASRPTLGQVPGSPGFGMLERRLHHVQVVLLQSVGEGDFAPACDRSYDLSKRLKCTGGIQAEFRGHAHERIYARARAVIVDPGAQVLRARTWVGVEVKRR